MYAAWLPGNLRDGSGSRGHALAPIGGGEDPAATTCRCARVRGQPCYARRPGGIEPHCGHCATWRPCVGGSPDADANIRLLAASRRQVGEIVSERRVKAVAIAIETFAGGRDWDTAWSLGPVPDIRRVPGRGSDPRFPRQRARLSGRHGHDRPRVLHRRVRGFAGASDHRRGAPWPYFRPFRPTWSSARSARRRVPARVRQRAPGEGRLRAQRQATLQAGRVEERVHGPAEVDVPLRQRAAASGAATTTGAARCTSSTRTSTTARAQMDVGTGANMNDPRLNQLDGTLAHTGEHAGVHERLRRLRHGRQPPRVGRRSRRARSRAATTSTRTSTATAATTGRPRTRSRTTTTRRASAAAPTPSPTRTASTRARMRYISGRPMDPKALHARLAEAARRFHSESIDERGGRDPVAALYAERRAAYSLFSLPLADADCEALRPYLFGRPIPRKAGDAPVACLNLVDGEWRRTARARADEVPRRSPRSRSWSSRARARATARIAIDRAHAFWASLEWAQRGARLPQARHQELLAPAPVLLRGVPRRAPPADAEDPARGRQGLLGGQARRRSPRGQRREGDDAARSSRR